MVTHTIINYSVFWAMDHFRRYVWRRVILVARVDLAVQKSERCLQEEEVSFELNLIRHGSTSHPELTRIELITELPICSIPDHKR